MIPPKDIDAATGEVLGETPKTTLSATSQVACEVTGAGVPNMAANPVEAAIYWAKAAAHGEVATLLSKVMAGLSLTETKRQLGVTQGKRNDLVADDRLSSGWDSFTKKHLGVSRETARAWMQLGELAKVRLRKMGTFDAGDVLDLAAMTAGQFEDLKKALTKLCDGKTQDQLALDLGLMKSNKRGKGGARTPALPGEGEDVLDADDVPEGWAEDEWREYVTLATENPTAREAWDAWKPHMDFLRDAGLDGKSWAHLPTRMKHELGATIAELGKLLKGAK